MIWTYCFLAFIVFLILLIIYLFTHKKTKGTKKPFRFVVWGVGILTIALFAAACILPVDNQNESLSKQESTEYYLHFYLQSITGNLIIFFRILINCFRQIRI